MAQLQALQAEKQAEISAAAAVFRAAQAYPDSGAVDWLVRRFAKRWNAS